jgi:hypothetical protein
VFAAPTGPPVATPVARVCPSGHGPLRLRSDINDHETWCGTWWACPDPAHKYTVVVPSEQLAKREAAHARLGKPDTYFGLVAAGIFPARTPGASS